ncbi:hypothetical protein, partial [uncultured Alistipes sp.]|uniref:hypothetical protein n=1 Tax=uncultured Alistipes sp. TaxID=538949 RepID=UPI0026267FE9
ADRLGPGIIPRVKTITQKEEQHAAACCSEPKNRYICISEESEGACTDTLFETLPKNHLESNVNPRSRKIKSEASTNPFAVQMPYKFKQKPRCRYLQRGFCEV